MRQEINTPPAADTTGRLSRACLTCLLTLVIFLPSAVADTLDRIDALRWQNRLVLIFAAPGSDDDIADLETRLASLECELRDRDLVIVRIGPGDSVSMAEGTANTDAGALRDRYRVAPNETAVLLIGKDGGVKLRDGAAVDLSSMFDLIDGMPMRRREMRERGEPC